MTPQPLSTPFAFDTEFDASGVVVHAAAAGVEDGVEGEFAGGGGDHQ